MKFKMFLLLLLGSFTSTFAGELPKGCFGNYGGEMPSYSVIINGNNLAIDKHDVYITISKERIIYAGGDLKLSGTYTVFKQNKSEYVIKAALSNGKTLNCEMDLIWNKKAKKIYITPKNGQSEAILERLDV